MCVNIEERRSDQETGSARTRQRIRKKSALIHDSERYAESKSFGKRGGGEKVTVEGRERWQQGGKIALEIIHSDVRIRPGASPMLAVARQRGGRERKNRKVQGKGGGCIDHDKDAKKKVRERIRGRDTVTIAVIADVVF